MRSTTSAILLAGLALALTAYGVGATRAADDFQRYHAAITKVFLSDYSAIPVFHLNPLAPGDVVQLDNETVTLSHTRCYPGMVARPLNIQPFEAGETIGASVRFKAQGEALDKEILQVEAGLSAETSNDITITVEPLSESRAPDIQSLRAVSGDPACARIAGLLDKSFGREVVAFGVLNGRVRFKVTTKFSGQIDAKAEGEIAKLIAKAFSITEADIKLSANSATSLVSGSPGDLPLALIPASYSKEELARITYFMQGERGARLEELVDAAIRTSDANVFDTRLREIRVLLGQDEAVKENERWLERFFSGERLVPTEQLRESGKEVDFHKVGIYAAARELVQPTGDRAP